MQVVSTQFLAITFLYQYSHLGKGNLHQGGIHHIQTNGASHNTDHEHPLNQLVLDLNLPQILIGASSSSSIG
jgi:hypothetical protein